jgi:hypothetical protein
MHAVCIADAHRAHVYAHKCGSIHAGRTGKPWVRSECMVGLVSMLYAHRSDTGDMILCCYALECMTYMVQ